RGRAAEAVPIHSRAAAILREAVRRTPGDPFARLNLGNVLYAQDRPDEAAAEYREAVRLEPDFVLPYNNLAIALAARGKRDEAAAVLREAIRRKPGERQFHYQAQAHDILGNVLRDQGQLTVCSIMQIRT